MKEREELIELFDIYGNLLTDKQKTYFKNYYFEDLSLSEIADNYNVSKALIGKTISITENKLKNYEESLHILNNKKELKLIINKTNDVSIKNELQKLL